jgi:hypothetical protein
MEEWSNGVMGENVTSYRLRVTLSNSRIERSATVKYRHISHGRHSVELRVATLRLATYGRNRVGGKRIRKKDKGIRVKSERSIPMDKCRIIVDKLKLLE